MSFSDDVRSHFEGEARRHPTPAGLRAAVVAEASAAAPAERQAPRWAAVAAVILTLAIVAAFFAAGALSRHTVPIGPAPLKVSPPPQSPQSELRSPVAVDVATYDGQTGWALLADCSASNNKCQYEVVETTDGGATWSAPNKVGPLYQGLGGDEPTTIYFPSPTDGFVYGHNAGFATHDAGKTWGAIGPQFLEVVAIRGSDPLWLVIYPCQKGTVCPYEVLVSHDFGKSWTAAAPLDATVSPANVVAFGLRGLLLGGFGAGDLTVTTDGGASWTHVAGRCAPETFENYVATPDGVEIWQYCGGEPPLASPPPSRPQEALWVSEDGGRTWARRTALGGVTVGAELVSPVPHTAILLGAETVFSSDSGLSWHPVDGGNVVLRSISVAASVPVIDSCAGRCWPREAWGIDGGGALWVSHDAVM
jgi:photosystem II stability/assembly factor-like uncharacterized protein